MAVERIVEGTGGSNTAIMTQGGISCHINNDWDWRGLAWIGTDGG